VHVDASLDEVRAQAAFRQLQPSPGPGDGVVVADRALLDDTENLAPGFGAIRHEGTALLLRRDRKGHRIGLAGPGKPPDLAIRANIEIPEQKISARWSLRRNDDKALPASHPTACASGAAK
jgi:hypothetical protein